MPARCHGFMIQQVLNIARARDVAAGKCPALATTAENHTIIRTSHIQHMLCSIRRVKGSSAIPGSPVFEVCRVLQGAIPVLGAVSGSQSEGIITTELDRGIRGVSAPEIIRCVNVRRAGERAAGANEHGRKCIGCVRAIPGDGHSVGNAVLISLCGRQLNARAAREHFLIALDFQGCRRQLRRRCQTRATPEHALVAARRQRSCRQFRSCCQTRAIIEQIAIAALTHVRMLARCHGFMIQQVLNIARTGDICAGKRPALSTTAGNHTITRASHIQHVLCSVGRVEGCRAVPGSPVFEVYGIFQSAIPVLGAIGSSKRESIFTGELDRAIRGVSAPEVVCSVNFGRATEGAACAGEHIGECVACCYTIPRNGHSVRDTILACLCGRQLDACAAIEHVRIAIRCQRSRRQFRRRCQASATVKHVVIAVVCQRSRRQFRSRCQAGAAGEHDGIAGVCQRSRRQFRSCCQAGAAVEHGGITVGCQRRCRQFWRCRQTRAAVEHVGIAGVGQRSGRQFGGFCQARAAAEHTVVAREGQRSGRKLRSRCKTRAAPEHVAVAVIRQRNRRKLRR